MSLLNKTERMCNPEHVGQIRNAVGKAFTEGDRKEKVGGKEGY